MAHIINGVGGGKRLSSYDMKIFMPNLKIKACFPASIKISKLGFPNKKQSKIH